MTTQASSGIAPVAPLRQPQTDAPDTACELTILMPCLNEAETLERCIIKAKSFLAGSGVRGEVLIADNGSTDGSQDIARANGARVVPIEKRGYGSALMGGISAARGRYVIMGDSDDSYDFGRLELFVEKLRQGYQLVMGNRFKGGIKPGAMPPLHRYLGNPVLSTIGRVFYGSPVTDFHCGLRGFDRQAILDLDLRSPGMEFASEMVVKATLHHLRMAEVPTILSPDGRSRPPHLRSWRDGWRHLRFLLTYSPRWLFLFPGMALFAAGLVAMAVLLPGPLTLGSVTFDVHTLFYASLATVVGFFCMQFWLFSKLYGIQEGVVPSDPAFLQAVRRITLEKALIVGIALLIVGLGLGIYAVEYWGSVAFQTLSASQTMRLVIPSGTAILLGFHVIFGGFFLNVLDVQAGRASAAGGVR